MLPAPARSLARSTGWQDQHTKESSAQARGREGPDEVSGQRGREGGPKKELRRQPGKQVTPRLRAGLHSPSLRRTNVTEYTGVPEGGRRGSDCGKVKCKREH